MGVDVLETKDLSIRLMLMRLSRTRSVHSPLTLAAGDPQEGLLVLLAGFSKQESGGRGGGRARMASFTP